MVCSTKFGRNSKISLEQVFNMFQADGWIVNYAGYRAIPEDPVLINGIGRGSFTSARSNKMFVVISQYVYSVTAQVDDSLVVTQIGVLNTSTGDVFIDENLKSQIAFCDKQNVYIYDYSTSVFQILNLGFFAGYVIFQDNRFIVSVNGKPEWQLSDFNLLAIYTATPVGGTTGSGYHVNDLLTVLDGNGGILKVATIDGGGGVTSVTIDTAGSGYSNRVYGVSGGFGTAASFNIVVTSGFAQTSAQIGSFQTKPDNVVACVRMPGKTGQILIMGNTVTEVWTDLGLQLFPYQRNSSYSIDYGCLNPATIASGDDFIVWLGANERSGPVIMYCSGGSINQISTDGINFRLSELVNPENSFGFIFKQDGHVFYQITFPSPEDNITYTYDFTTQKFYTLCDVNENCHIARRVAYYNNSYYFVSFNDGSIYRLDSNYEDYNGAEIPRIIITPTSALPDRSSFIVNNITFPIEQGTDENDARVDLCTSSDGGVTFGNTTGIQLQPLGKRRNIFKFYNLGRYNEVIFQFRFWGFGRFVLTNGVAEVTQ
jgi:hypothetical protein